MWREPDAGMAAAPPQRSVEGQETGRGVEGEEQMQTRTLVCKQSVRQRAAFGAVTVISLAG